MSTGTDLPYVDTHTVSVALGPDPVWIALHGYATRLGLGEGSLLSRVWGTEPARGFAVVDQVVGESITLEGRHRFSVYRLTFAVERRTAQRTTLLHATTHAAFPGPHGRVYRALVIGTGLHGIATRRMLRAVAAAARG